MAVLKFKNGDSWEEIKIPEPQAAVSLKGMCYVTYYQGYNPAELYGGTWSRVMPTTSYNYVITSAQISGQYQYVRMTNDSYGNEYARTCPLYIWIRTA